MSVIVVSGIPGTGTNTVGKLLAKKLNLEFISIERYKEKKKKYNIKLDNLQDYLAQHSNIVIESNMGIYSLKNKADFCVWLKALKSSRIKRYANKYNISTTKAEHQLSAREKEEKQLFLALYKTDYTKQEHQADLVMDTTDRPTEDIVDQIIRDIPK